MSKSLLLILALVTLPLTAGAAAPAAPEDQGPDDQVPDHAVVLIYHHVAEDTPEFTSVAPSLFRKHLDHLDEEGFQVLPLAVIVDSLRQGGTLADRTVALTFDDGYRSVYTEAFPMLRERGWPFTVFVCPDKIDDGKGPFLTWDQLREMTTAGATVANHGLNHGHLHRQREGETADGWRVRVRGELIQAQQRIAGEIGYVEPLFAYPYGEFAPALQAILEGLGWAAFGQQSGPMGFGSDFTILPRFPMAGPFAAMEYFPVKVASLPLPVILAEPAAPQLPGTHETAEPEALRPRLRITLGPGKFRVGQLAAYASEQGAADIAPVPGVDRAFEVRCRQSLRNGRSRYNITAPATDGRRYYWYSHTWIVGDRHKD